MIIRAATMDDMDQLCQMAGQFYEVAGYADSIPFDTESCKFYIEMGIEQGLCFVADKGSLVGFISGIAFPAIMNMDYLVGSELAWWVELEDRGNVGIKLLKAIEESAKARGIKMWSMMSLEAQNPEMVDSLYKRLGYKATEHTYSKVF